MRSSGWIGTMTAIGLALTVSCGGGDGPGAPAAGAEGGSGGSAAGAPDGGEPVRPGDLPPRGEDGGGPGGAPGVGDGDGAVAASIVEVIEAALSSEDAFTAALEAGVDRELDGFEVDYLYELDWGAAASEGLLLTDPLFLRLMSVVASVAEALPEEAAGFPIRFRSGAGCVEDRVRFFQERIRLRCLPVPPPIMVSLGAMPSRSAAVGVVAAVVTHPGDAFPDEDSDSGLAEKARAVADCTPPGTLADPDRYLFGHPCIDNGCLRIDEVRRGQWCGDPDSIGLRYTNVCDAPIDVRTCFERADPERSETCGRESNLDPGAQGGLGAWACEVTGRVSVYAMPSGASGCSFPTESRTLWNLP